MIRDVEIKVMGKELFKVVKEKYGANLNSLIQEKVTLLAGDITRHNLGLDTSTLEELFGQVDFLINSAASTDFDERYDVALGINTIGPANVLNFSKKCSKLRVFLHVSTAYVCGEKEGVVLEKPFKLGDTLNGTSGLNIDMEKVLVEEKLEELRTIKASEKHVTSVMRDFGIQRARKYGWPNTYSFTKAMGEMLLGHFKDDKTPLALVIIRPTIITSTFKEPFPGWLEGLRNIDSFIVGYGKGKMTGFPGCPESIVDLIPADMVVNAMIAAMAAHADEPIEMIYHVGSSISNPVLYRRLQNYGHRYFSERPWINKDGKAVVVRKGTELGTVAKILSVVNIASCQYFRGTYVDLARKVKFLMRLVELFTPYVFFKGVFDDTNTERLRRWAERENDNEMLNFDPKSINWDDYFMYTHIAGVVKYAFTR
ncbi:UNVERIFIED_CONTAM: Fatty acyl-CoA reductase 3 [Sesamum radiatum]|uniref:Fatty acyl-CoA reductase n=1 Tax=Sesamum radiatum TaxID=300843 RepID=A0AAW2UKB2_SESRA